jgi:hypothetical protein
VDQKPKENHRRREKRVPSVRFYPLGADGTVYTGRGFECGFVKTPEVLFTRDGSIQTTAAKPLPEVDEIGLNINNGGFIQLLNSALQPKVFLSQDTGGAGFIALAGSGNTQMVHISSMVGAMNNGSISVTDAAGATAGVWKAAMYVDTSGQGTIEASVKNFRVPNPRQPNTDIVYACIEGPEAAAYVRGTAHLANGQAIVLFPAHFVTVAGAGGMTVQVTPLSADSLGLAVIEKRDSAIVVKELHGGTGNYDFDWQVTSPRKGYENYQVIRPSNETSLPQPLSKKESST